MQVISSVKRTMLTQHCWVIKTREYVDLLKVDLSKDVDPYVDLSLQLRLQVTDGLHMLKNFLESKLL